MNESIVSCHSSGTLTVCKTVADLKAELRERKVQNKTIGLVPTMGALHEGHLSLINIARENADEVVVSIFVNPAQFGPGEDFESYPRNLESDLEACAEAGVNIVFAPDRNELYSEKNNFKIEIESLNKYMCGGSRPGFFEGVILIVNKLFNIVEPDIAVFGQKDIQQVQIIKQMVKEFNHGVRILICPIQRANDGLALSSRNAYLTDEQRITAPGLFRSLQYVKTQITEGVHTPELLIKHQKSELEAKGFVIDYFNVYSLKKLGPVDTLKKDETYIIAGAVYLGKTRLIDNILIEL